MQLNPNQEIAVRHKDGPLLILAGPGSGKTRVLVQRIAHLIHHHHISPYQILAVTFTNKAASEMKTRVNSLIGDFRNLSIGTFHSLCLRILRSHAEMIGYSQNFVIYDDADQMALIKECMMTLNLSIERISPRGVLERISRAKDACLDVSAYIKENQDNIFLKTVGKIYEAYQKRLDALQAMDFGDLIRLTVQLFNENPTVLESYHNRWHYIMVDEYQDTNNAQYQFVKLLANKQKNICVVGDEDQSIYRWRGADVSNILRFEKDFPGAQSIELVQNYRSSQIILNAANAVVKNNFSRRDKTIWTENNAGDKIRLLSCETERHEAEWVAKDIGKLALQGVHHNQIAVFYRTNAQSRPFEDVFRQYGLAYRIVGGIRFYQRAEVKDILAFMRLIMDSSDDIAFKRIVNVPARGLGKTSVSKLIAYATAHQISLFDAIDASIQSGIIQKSAATRFGQFKSIIMECVQAYPMPLSDFVRYILEKTNYIESLTTQSSVNAESKLENINELVSAMEEFIPENANNALAEFLDQVALVSEVDQLDDSRGMITLMTIHLAKGLEFPAVYMVGMEEGLFPHIRSHDKPEEMEEERRLCYVGITRAEKHLTLSHAFRRRQFGQEKCNAASRFLAEIPEDYLTRIGKQSVAQSTNYQGMGYTSDVDYDMDFDQTPACEQSQYAKGVTVSHPLFGQGIVSSCQATSAGHRVTVQFSNGDIKRLIAECAGLQIL